MVGLTGAMLWCRWPAVPIAKSEPWQRRSRIELTERIENSFNHEPLATEPVCLMLSSCAQLIRKSRP